MRKRTKVALAVLAASAIVTPSVMVPDWGVAPMEPTGFFWLEHDPYGLGEEVWRAGGGAHWERLSPNPEPNPPIEAMWKPTIEELLEKIRQPNNFYMACGTHGGPNGLDTPGPGGLYTVDIVEAMQGREPFRLVMMYACSSADGGLCDAFTKGLGTNTACIACTDPFFGGKVRPRFELFVDLVSDPLSQNR
ncbi:unnamed protein product, partial [marine sediment metagenome]